MFNNPSQPAPAPPITNNSEELVSVREHAMRKLESKGFDWNTVIEVSN